MQLQIEFHLQPKFLESLTNKECSPKPWQLEVGHHPDETRLQLTWMTFLGVKLTSN